jgi:hypothetical protein
MGASSDSSGKDRPASPSRSTWWVHSLLGALAVLLLQAAYGALAPASPLPPQQVHAQPPQAQAQAQPLSQQHPSPGAALAGGAAAAAAAAARAQLPGGGFSPPQLVPGLGALSDLYAKYREELLEVRKLALKFCSTPKPAGFPHTHKCLSTLEEMELLYIGIREAPPANMLEVASASGYSTLWILMALHRNGRGVLHSFDLFQTPYPDVLDPALGQRHWRFTLGDVLKTYPSYAKESGIFFDRLLIDAEHTAAFGYFYIDAIIQPQMALLQVRANNASAPATMDFTVHDLYHYENSQGVTGEGEVVLKWMGYMTPLAHLQCLPTFNMIHRPERHEAIRSIQKIVLGAEAEAQAPLIGQFPHGDLSLRCTVWAEPMKK